MAMDYAANAINSDHAKAQFYAGNAGTGGVNKAVEAPRTIASAASRIDELNARLSNATESLSMISSQLGALTPVAGGENKNAPAASGAVYRLNDAADAAHSRLMEIENLIGGIARALG